MTMPKQNRPKKERYQKRVISNHSIAKQAPLQETVLFLLIIDVYMPPVTIKVLLTVVAILMWIGFVWHLIYTYPEEIDDIIDERIIEDTDKYSSDEEL